MNTRVSIAVLATGLIAIPAHSLAADRLTLTGKVTDAAGKSLDHATVMVYHAGVKQGYSTFCPSCYSDCGKRTLTDAAGNFTIRSLSPDLYFELLIVHDGYLPTFMKKVDPAKPAPTAAMKPREAVTDPRRVLRGLVVDAHHRPIRDAVVQPQGILGETPNGRRGSIYGSVPGLDPVAVTNDKGEFELMHDKPFDAMVLQVEARGMASKIFTSLASGTERHTLAVSEGATIRGRFLHSGKPVPNAEVGLIARKRGWGANLVLVGYPLPEIRIGTNNDGTFAITNVPPAVDWYLYGKMESVAARGGAPIIECTTKSDGEEVDVGDLSIMPAFYLRGRVVLSDGKPVPAGMRVTVGSDRAFDSQTTLLSRDGAFEFSGLAKGSYTISASVKGYPGSMPLKLENDVSDFVMTLDPQ
jgi:Carboxypeptidase regulatory-like domain/Dioxygenase